MIADEDFMLEIGEALNLEIVKELLHQDYPNEVISDEQISRIFVSCKDNPWDASVLYSLLKLTNQL